MSSLSFTATTPPTEIGLIPNSVWVTAKRPLAINEPPPSSTRTGADAGRVTSRIVT